MKIPPSLIEIHRRAELTNPLLVFITEVFTRLRDPTVKFLERLAELRLMRAFMEKKHMKDAVSRFLSVVCERDKEAAKAGVPTKSKRE